MRVNHKTERQPVVAPSEANESRGPETEATAGSFDGGTEPAVETVEQEDAATVMAESPENESRQTRVGPGGVLVRPVNDSGSGASTGRSDQGFDQRAAALRDRVVQAQQALETRAKRLRAILNHDRQRLHSYHAKLREKAKELAAAARTERARREAEFAAQRAQLDADRAELDRARSELAELRAEVDRGRQQLEIRQGESEARATELGRQRAEVDDHFQSKLAELEQVARQEVARHKAKLEEKLRARWAEVEQAASVRQGDQAREASASHGLVEELAARETELSARAAELSAREEVFAKECAAKAAELERKGQILREQAEQKRQELLGRVASTRAEWDEAVARHQAELEEVRRTIGEREAAVAQREAELEESRRAAEFARRAEELARSSAGLQASEKHLGDRQDQLAEAEARLEEDRRQLGLRLSEVEQAQEKERLRQADLARREELLAWRLAEHEQYSARLETTRREVETSRAELERGCGELDGRKAELDESLNRIGERQRALDETERRLAEEQSVQRQQLAELACAKAAWEEQRAGLERELLAMRDQERVLAGERAQLQADREVLEETVRETARKLADVEESRGELAGEGERLRVRKTRVDEEAAALETRRRESEALAARLGERERAVAQEEQRLEAQRASFSADRDRLEGEGTELEESRRTFQAGLRSLEEERSDLQHREAKLAERAGQLEEFRNRLEEEYAALQRRREEFATVQQERGGAAEHAAALMRGAEEREQAVREREAELIAHQQALAARTAELTRDEAELRRQRGELESGQGQLQLEQSVLKQRREELEAEFAAQVAEFEQRREQTEGELKEEREVLVEKRRQITEEIAGQRQADEASQAEQAAFERAVMGEIRRQAEAEAAERSAAAARNEVEVRERCAQRLADVERDIHQRLTVLEQEIRGRREAAERDLEERRKLLDAEMAKVRRRLDEQIEALRRRQAVVVGKQAVFDEHRHVRERETRGSQARLAASAPKPIRPGSAAPQLDEAAITAEADVLVPPEIADEWGQQAGTQGDFVLEEEQHAAPVLPVGRSSAAPQAMPAWEDQHTPGEIVPSTDTVGMAVEAVGEETRPTVMAAAAAAAAAPRRVRLVWACLGGLLLGGLTALAVLWWPAHETRVRGLLVLARTGSGAALTPQEHVAGLTNEAVLRKASADTGTDLLRLHQEKALRIAPSGSGDAVELETDVPSGDAPAVRTAEQQLAALAATYASSLGQLHPTKEQRQRQVAELEERLRHVTGQREAAEKSLRELQEVLDADPRLQALERARADKAELGKQVAAARQDVEKQKAALAELLSAPAEASIVPSEAQLEQMYATDAELTQAAQQQQAKARQFHQVLSGAMSDSQIPLTAFLASIDGVVIEVNKQLGEQTDTDIRQELERIALDLRDCREAGEAFSRTWDELGPKVAAWTSEAGPEVLLEYQRKAEAAVRELHKASGEAMAAAVRKADAIGQGGTEMTKRRIIQNALMKLAHSCDEARTEWIRAAWGVVPANNPELKALRAAIADLTPRITERRGAIRDRLVKHLESVAQRERVERERQLRNDLAEATRRHQELSDQFVKLDAEVSNQEREVGPDLDSRRAVIEVRKMELAGVQQDEAALLGALDSARSGQPESLADAVAYRPQEPVKPDRFTMGMISTAAGLGGAVALGFVLLVWACGGLRRGRL